MDCCIMYLRGLNYGKVVYAAVACTHFSTESYKNTKDTICMCKVILID